MSKPLHAMSGESAGKSWQQPRDVALRDGHGNEQFASRNATDKLTWSRLSKILSRADEMSDGSTFRELRPAAHAYTRLRYLRFVG